MVSKIIDVKILKNGRVGGYIIENNVKKFRFLSNKDVEKIVMKGGNSEIVIDRKLKRLLKNKIMSYWKAPFNKQHREKRKEYKGILKNLKNGNKSNRNTINSFKKLMSKHNTKNKRRKKKINNLNCELLKIEKKKLNKKLTIQGRCSWDWGQIVSQIFNNENRNKNLDKDISNYEQARGGFGKVYIFEFQGNKYVIKRNYYIQDESQDESQRNKIIQSIKEEYLINKKLFDKCQKLLKDEKLIDIDYNFINEPICITNDFDIVLIYGGNAVKNNVNVNVVENIKKLLLNFVLLELEFRPIFFCTDLKPDNILKDEGGLIRFIDFGNFCDFNRIISNYTTKNCSGRIIKPENYLDSDDCFDEELKDKLINFNKKYSRKNYLDLFLTIYAVSYIIFIYQSIEFFSNNKSFGNTVNKAILSKNHINLLFTNSILIKCFKLEENKNKIKIFFYPTNYTNSPFFGQHTIKGLQAKTMGNRQTEVKISEDLDHLFTLFS
jgi:hypothetical protein